MTDRIHGSGGGGEPPPPPPVHTPQEAPNTLRSKASAKIIDIISEGSVKGLVGGAKGIFLDGVALQDSGGGFNFQGVTFIERLGFPDQDPIPGFAETESENNVGIEVKEGAPVVVTIVDQDIDAVRVKIAVPALFVQTDLGDINGTDVQLRIEVRGSGENYVTKLTPTISGKTMGPYEQQHRIELEGTAPWDIRVSRITPDATDAKLNNKTSFVGYTEVIDANLIYPDSALTALVVDSELFGGRVPARAYLCEGLEIAVPTNYDPETRIYTGIWDGTFKIAFTDNPAWVLHDILTSVRYGLGDFIEQTNVDKFGLFTIAQYCDELVPDGFGGMEPRFTLNALINTRVEAYTLINTIASAFRGMVFWAAGAVTAAQDSPAEASRLVTPANVIGGDFTYEGSALNARHTAAHVTWNDPADQYKPAIEVIEDPDMIFTHGLRPIDVNAFGCTSRGQANRVGRWILDSEQNETETVKYAAGFDHADTAPGAIVAISDPSRVGARLGGRLVDVTGVNVTLDQDYTVVAGDKILIMLADDTVAEKDIISNVAANIIEIDSVLATAPVVNAMYVVQPLTAAPTLWRVISVVEDDAHNFEVTALRHDATKYDRIEAGVNIEELPTSLFPTGPMVAPTNLTVIENLYKSNNSVKTRLNISFTPSNDPRVGLYRVEVRPPLGNWEILQISTSSVAEYTDAQTGFWDFAVTAMSSGGAEAKDSARIEINNLEIFGKTAPPGDVQNFIADRRPDGVFLRWDEVPDLDLVGYDIRLGDDFGSGEVIADLFVGTSIFVPLNTAAAVTFLIRARDELGIPSSNVTSVVTQLIAPPPVTGFQGFPQGASINFEWNPVIADNFGNPLLVSYEVRAGVTWESSQTVIRTGATSKTILFPRKLAEEVTFHIKSISQAGVFSDDAAFFTVGQAPEINRNEILVKDIQAAGWIGIKNNMEVVSDNLLLAEVSPGVAALYGEYAESIDLGLSWRARNWLETRMILFEDSPLQWQDANFAWNDPQAITPWLPTADTDNATFEAWLAEENFDSEPPELNEGWTLDDTLVGYRLFTPAVESLNVTFEDARYRQGLKVNQNTRVAWDFLFPNTMTFFITLKYAVVPTNDVVYWRAVSAVPGEFLEIGFENATGLTYCRDHLGNKLTIDTRITLNNFAIIAVAQDADNRAFYIYETETDTVLSDTAAFSDITDLNNLAMHAL